MSAQQLFKAARIGVIVTLVSVSTLAFVQTERGRSVYAHYFQPLSASQKVAVVVSDPKDTTDTKTSSSVAKTSPTNSGSQTEQAPEDKTAGSTAVTGPGTAGTGTPGSASGHTTGSSATTTGAAPSAVLVRAYNGQAADIRLKFVLDDLRVDLRKAGQEIADAKGRAPALAVRTALDVISRSQDRTETLLDIARDIDVSRSLKGNLSTPEKAAAASSESATFGMVRVPKEASSWLEPGTVIGIVTLLVAVLVFWFGDNLSGRFAKRRDLVISVPSQVQALAGPAETVQLERQPASTTAAAASMK
ncbi:MAG: hypothetical protein C0480_15465 [Bradyrhizobium sp.]|nr:hypothetical protein [Bradyrhizobium sp.]